MNDHEFEDIENMKRRLVEEDIVNLYNHSCIGCVGAFVVIAMFLVSLFIVFSCKSQETIEKPVIVTKVSNDTIVRKDTVFVQNWREDKVYVKDSVWARQWIRGDTVFIETNKEHNEYNYQFGKDSTHVAKIDSVVVYDSIPYPVEVKAIEYVEKDLNAFQTAALYIGYACMALIAFLLIYWSVKHFRE